MNGLRCLPDVPCLDQTWRRAAQQASRAVTSPSTPHVSSRRQLVGLRTVILKQLDGRYPRGGQTPFADDGSKPPTPVQCTRHESPGQAAPICGERMRQAGNCGGGGGDCSRNQRTPGACTSYQGLESSRRPWRGARHASRGPPTRAGPAGDRARFFIWPMFGVTAQAGHRTRHAERPRFFARAVPTASRFPTRQHNPCHRGHTHL